MKAKTKVVLSSAMAIAMSASLITGASIAILTDEAQVNIVTSSASVKVNAYINEDSIKTYSGKWDGAQYVPEEQANDKFVNGGGVIYDTKANNEITIDKIAPTDSVKFDIVIENLSDITIKYQTRISLVDGDEENGKLFQALDITFGEGKNTVSYEGETLTASYWNTIDPVTGEDKTAVVVPVTIAFPAEVIDDTTGEDVSNEYAGKTIKIKYTVAAVQGNANTNDDSISYISSEEELVEFANKVNQGVNNYSGKTVVLTKSLNLDGINWTPIGPNADNSKKFYGTFDGNGYTISNLTVNQGAAYHAAGLFGGLNGTVKNLIIENANITNVSSGAATSNGTAVVAGSIYTKGNIENVQVIGANVKGNRYVAGIAGYVYGNIKGCSVTDATIVAECDDLTGEYDNGDKVGGIAGYFASKSVYKVSGNTVENVTVQGYRDIGGIAGYAKDSVVNNKVNGLTLIIDNTHNYKNYTAVANHDANAIVGEGAVAVTNVAENVVKVYGDTTFVSTVADLAAAVQVGGNVVMEADLELTQPLEIPDDVNVTLDTGKYTLSKAAVATFSLKAAANHTIINNGTLTVCGDGWVLADGTTDANAIYNAGKLTLNGTVGYVSENGYAVANVGDTVINGGYIQKSFGLVRTDAGTLTVNGGYIGQTIAPSSTHAIRVENSKVEINGGYIEHGENQGSALFLKDNADVTVWGGNIVTYSESYLIDIQSESAKLNVKDGTFTGEYVRAFTGNVTISGGSLNIDTYHVSASAVTVYGGSFKNDGLKNCVADGYEMTDSYDVFVGSTKAEAIENELANGGEVKLESDFATNATSGGYSQAGLVQNGGVLDGNGNTVSAEKANGTWDCTIYTTGGTIKNVTVASGFRGIFMAGLNEDLIIDNVIFKNVTYTISADGSNPNYEIKVSNSAMNGWTSFTSGFKAVSFTNCTFAEGNGYAYCRPYMTTTFTNCHFAEGYRLDASQAAHVFVNCTYGDAKTPLTAENINVLVGSSMANGCVNGEYVVSTSEYLESIIKTDAKELVINLLADVSLNTGDAYLKIGGANTEKLVINGNGKKLTLTTSYWSRLNLANENGTLYLNDLTVTSSQTSGTWNSYDVTFNCNTTLNNVVFEKAVALDGVNKTFVLNKVTISETHDYYALWVSANGANVEIDGLTVNSDGRGIKIDEQYCGDSTALTTLKISNATFNTAKKAAILVKTAQGANITVENVNIANVKGDSVNAVWNDSDSADYFNLIKVEGATIAQEQ